MRRLLSIACLLLLASAAIHAQINTPNQINYQGRLTDGAGQPVADGNYLIKFTIYDGPGGGATDLWNSGFQNITVTDGLFNYALGSDIVFPDGLFADSVRYLGITVGVDPEISPRSRFLSAAYAFEGPFVSLTGDVMSGALAIDDPGGQVVILDPSQIGDNAVILPPNSISLSEFDSTQVPRIAQRNLNDLRGTSSLTPVSIDTFQVSWPADGYLYINVSGQCYLDIDATGSSALTNYASIGLCTDPNSLSACENTFQNVYFQDADNASPTNETKFFALSTVVTVFGAGIDTYFLNARTANALNEFNLFEDVRATVMYFPLTGGLPVLSPPSTDNGPTLQQD